MIVNLLFAIVIHGTPLNNDINLNEILGNMNYGLNTEQQIGLTDKELRCLALNVYHESRGESLKGQFAVAEVTLNRKEDDRYPDDVCSVVWQKNQFSWTSDGKSDNPSDHKSWKNAQQIARVVSIRHNTNINITNGATMFHSVNARPSWRNKFIKTIQIGRHVFYR